MCGRRVAAAFDHRDPALPYLRWSEEGEPFRWAMLPHPSGVNRWWNEPENREAAREFLRQLLLEGKT